MKNKSIFCLTTLKAILIIFTGFLTSQNLSAQGWYDTDWSYRTPVTITNSGNALTDYQVQISLGSSFNWSNVQDDGDDIRFTPSDEENPIDFWIESWDYETSAVIWVEVPLIAASANTIIYLYYGNSSATSVSNGENTFAFFDGFDSGTNVNTDKWTYVNSIATQTSVANGNLTMLAKFGGYSYSRIDGNLEFSTGYVFESRGRHPDQGNTGKIIESGFVQSSGTNYFYHCLRIMDDNPSLTNWVRRTQTGSDIGPLTTMSEEADQDFHIFRIYRNTDNTVDFEIDNTGKENEDENIPTGNLAPFLMSYSSASTNTTFIVDWTRVRKWADTDPSTSLGEQQELNTWNGSVDNDWSKSGNWSTTQVPGSTSYALIPDVTYDPVISGNDPVKISHDINIESSAILTIEPGGALTVGGELANNGTLNLDSDNSGIASLIVDSYSGTGTENIELYVTGLGTAPNYNWHYISSPVSNLSTNIFTGTTLNLAAFYESLPTAYTSEGWVAYDGYVYSTGVSDGPTFGSLAVGKGYDLYHDYSNYTFNLTGNLNTGDVNIPLSYTSTNVGEWNGLNLIGNPYTSSIDWSVIDDNLETGVGGAIYLTKAGSLVSWVNGVSTPGGEATGVIPPMQGFIVFTTTTGTSIDIVASRDRVHGDQPRYKSESIIPLLRLKLSDQSLSDETVICFDNLATEDFDYTYDAFKLMINESKNQLWTEIDNDKYSINTIPFPDDETVIPLMLNIPEAGQYTLKSTEIRGLDNYNVILTDLAQGNYQVDLKQIPEYTFSAEKGLNLNRFTVTLGDITTGFEDIESDKNFNIYTFADQLFIQNMSDNWNNSMVDVNVYDLTGRLIFKYLKKEINTGATIQLPFAKPDGIYLVEITSGVKRTVQKLSHR